MEARQDNKLKQTHRYETIDPYVVHKLWLIQDDTGCLGILARQAIGAWQLVPPFCRGSTCLKETCQFPTHSDRNVWGDGINSVSNKTRWWFQIFFIFTPKTGEMIQFDEHICQMGGNHQLEKQSALFQKPFVFIQDTPLGPRLPALSSKRWRYEDVFLDGVWNRSPAIVLEHLAAVTPKETVTVPLLPWIA